MTFIPLDASLRPFGAPPSMGRRENAASRTPHEDGFRYENAASPHSSFRAKARNLFRSRSRKDVRGAGNEKPSAPCAPEERCFMQTDSRMKQKMANEKDPSAALGMTIRANAPPARLFSPLRCQPPPLRGTSFHGKEGECRFTSST